MTRRIVPLLLVLSSCIAEPEVVGTPIAAEALCEEVARVVCQADRECFPDTPELEDCMEVQRTECGSSLQPLIDDPRLGYDALRGGAFVAALEENALSCWETPPDLDAFFEVFAGTGVAGADCTPGTLDAASLRISALSCADGNACRIHLRSDSTAEGVCEARSGSACSHAFDCGAGQFCSLPSRWQPGVWGECRPLRANGWECSSDLECASRHCAGTCSSDPEIDRPLTVPHAQIVLDADPIAYLRGSVSGGRLADASGNGHHAAIMGGATPSATGAAPGDETGALQLSGDAQYALVPAMSELEGAEGVTLECWFFAENPETARPILELGGGEALGPHVWNFDRGDRLFANFSPSTPDAAIMSGEAAVSMGAWHHAVATYDGGAGRLYLDGQRIGEVNVATPPALTGALHVGHRAAIGESGDAHFAGMIDEVAVYDRALDDARIRMHFDAGVSGVRENRFALFRWLAP
jgi:hypothetical protein